jgi:phosphoribosylanthranilate isomerase
MSIKIKICGITNTADALSAVESGADMLGFVFHEPSPRAVAVPRAAEIVRSLPPHIVRVGVFVNPDRERVIRAAGECGLNLLQFHGEEPPDYCLQFGLMSMKAFRLRDAQSLEILPRYRTDAWLLDSYAADKPGGTGETFNWDLAIAAKSRGTLIFLAGGLTPENVGLAIRKVRPFGVDVSSGVEAAPGKKDPSRVKAFITAAREAANESP